MTANSPTLFQKNIKIEQNGRNIKIFAKNEGENDLSRQFSIKSDKTKKCPKGSLERLDFLHRKSWSKLAQTSDKNRNGSGKNKRNRRKTYRHNSG